MTGSKYSSVAIGNFDGIHRGHDVIIKKLLEIGQRNNFTTIILTFNYSNKSMKKNSNNLKYITSFENKINLLKSYNTSEVSILDLDENISKYSPEKFITEILIKKYNVKHVVVGYNFRFGYKAEGNTDTLKHYGKQYGFDVSVVDEIEYNNLEVSSTAIRKYIQSGNIKEANSLLINNYTIYKNDYELENKIKGIIYENSEIITPVDGQYDVDINGKKAIVKISTDDDNNRILNFNFALKDKQNIIFLDK